MEEGTVPEAICPIDEWIEKQGFETTAEIDIPEKLADRVIGQDKAVAVIKKAAAQKRHVMLIGEPGTGKSMLANSMVEYLPQDELQDVIAYHNPEDPNEPRIRTVPAGKGKPIVAEQKALAMAQKQQKNSMLMVIVVMIIVTTLALYALGGFRDPTIILIGLFAVVILYFVFRSPNQRQEVMIVPKLIISHDESESCPFVDATGAHAGALLGDVKHDPFQSGGLETPAHDRLEPGAIHKASKGVLFVDEINMLRMESQQSLLTAMQEGRFSITGQSERSSGAMVKSEPVPCDFVLVCAGNMDAMQGMHPALRSRVRGYGYEIYMQNSMPDNDANRRKMLRFVAQEVAKDKKIPHFDKHAVAEIIREAQRRSGRRGELTLRLRELGGLIRVAGDVSREKNASIVSKADVLEAKRVARSLEQQIADRYIEARKIYKSFITEGQAVGMVNGLAAMNASSNMSEYSGIVLPIVAEVAPAQAKNAGKIIATGQLGDIAKEAVENVSALIKKYTSTDISSHDIHIQFVGTYDGVEGDSASISIATAVISALEDVPVHQSMAMTGSLSVRGKVLPVGGVTAKLEAAAEAGVKKVLIPRDNEKDVMIEDKYYDLIEIIPVDDLRDVLKHALVGGVKKENLLSKLSALVESKVLPKPLPHP
ncbi:MAG: ATP-dependent protease LonB [Candidatus Methanomethylophilaceae archaeon]